MPAPPAAERPPPPYRDAIFASSAAFDPAPTSPDERASKQEEIFKKYGVATGGGFDMIIFSFGSGFQRLGNGNNPRIAHLKQSSNRFVPINRDWHHMDS